MQTTICQKEGVFVKNCQARRDKWRGHNEFSVSRTQVSWAGLQQGWFTCHHFIGAEISPLTSRCVFGWWYIRRNSRERICSPKKKKPRLLWQRWCDCNDFKSTSSVSICSRFQSSQPANLTEAKSFCRIEWGTNCNVQMCQADIDPLILTQGCKQLPKTPPLTIDWTWMNLLFLDFLVAPLFFPVFYLSI